MATELLTFVLVQVTECSTHTITSLTAGITRTRVKVNAASLQIGPASKSKLGIHVDAPTVSQPMVSNH